MKRFLLLLFGLAILAGPIGSARADAPQITLVTPSGAQHTLSLEALTGTEDVVEQVYPVRSESEEAAVTVTGFSISALLAAAGIDPYGFSYLEVQRPGGGSVQLSNAQAVATGPAPVVYATSSGTAFLRPSSGATDYNAADSFEAPQGLTIALRKGASLQVRLEASPRKTAAGKKVAFHAIVERSGAGEELTYHWFFDDGNSAEGETVSHSYAKAGSYSVVVGVKAAGEETGTSAVVRVQVGEPAEGAPKRQGGGSNDAKAAPDHGTAKGDSGAASPSAGSTATPSGIRGTPERTSPQFVREGVPRIPRQPNRTSDPKPKPDKSPTKTKASKRAPAGEEVSGELLEGEAEAMPEAAAQPSAVAARTGTPQSAGPGGGGIPTAAWGIGAVVALLAGGALVEAGAFTDLIPRVRERLR